MELTCALNPKEIKYFRHNPHCTSVLCDVDNTYPTDPNHNIKGYTYVKDFNPSKWVSESNLKKLSLKDIKITEGTFETVDQLLSQPLVDYMPNSQRASTAMHIGQLKLFLATMQFLTKYSCKDQTTHVVYPGSAQGYNIDYLTRLFPNCLWYLYDPRDFHPILHKNHKIKIIEKDYFLKCHIAHLKSIIPEDEPVLLISDIRVCDDESEETVERDMRLQEEWVRDLKPLHAQLKFRLPRKESCVGEGLVDPFQYLDGELYLQMYAPRASTETRLVVSRRDDGTYEDVIYSLGTYEGLMYMFNKRMRVSSYIKPERKERVKWTDTCHDCSAMYDLVEEYIESRGLKISASELVKNIFIKVPNVGKRMHMDAISTLKKLSW